MKAKNQKSTFSWKALPPRSMPRLAELAHAQELIVAYLSQAAEMKKKSGEWARQWEQQLKTPPKTDQAYTVRLLAPNAHERLMLFIPKKMSAYALMETLRKHVGTEAKSWSGACFWDLSRLDRVDTGRALESLSALTLMAPWEPRGFGKRAQEASSPSTSLELSICTGLPAPQVRQHVEKGRILGEANNRVRELADLPSNTLTPKFYRSLVQEEAKARKARFEFWDIETLKKKKAGAFLAVVQADPKTESGIVHLKISSRLKTPRLRLTLVGKGLCFDTGGYNIKTSNYMYEMHRDMTGSAVAFSSTLAIAELFPQVEVDCYMALAENLVSPTAYRPNDVVIASNGLSIEVVDTDAEGRMVLADTLAFASAGKPDLLIDYATLTGAAIRSLDQRRSAVFSQDLALSRKAVDVGEQCGERLWNFPIGEDYNKNLKSDIADTLQCAHISNADHIYAATFLSKFVEEKVPWLHVDLSSGSHKGGLGLASTETTGFGVQWTVAFVESYLKSRR